MLGKISHKEIKGLWVLGGNKNLNGRQRKVWVTVAVGDEAPLKHKVEINEATYDISDFRDAIKAEFTPKLDFMPAAALKVKLGTRVTIGGQVWCQQPR